MLLESILVLSVQAPVPSTERTGSLAIRVVAADGLNVPDPVIHITPVGGTRRRWHENDVFEFERYELDVYAKGFYKEQVVVSIDSPRQSLVVELRIGSVAGHQTVRQRFIRKTNEPCRELVLTPMLVPSSSRLLISLDQEVTDVVGGLLGTWYFAALLQGGRPCYAQVIRIGGRDPISLGL